LTFVCTSCPCSVSLNLSEELPTVLGEFVTAYSDILIQLRFGVAVEPLILEWNQPKLYRGKPLLVSQLFAGDAISETASPLQLPSSPGLLLRCLYSNNGRETERRLIKLRALSFKTA